MLRFLSSNHDPPNLSNLFRRGVGLNHNGEVGLVLATVHLVLSSVLLFVVLVLLIGLLQRVRSCFSHEDNRHRFAVDVPSYLRNMVGNVATLDSCSGIGL